MNEMMPELDVIYNLYYELDHARVDDSRARAELREAIEYLRAANQRIDELTKEDDE